MNGLWEFRFPKKGIASNRYRVFLCLDIRKTTQGEKFRVGVALF